MAVDALDFLDEHDVVVDADPGPTWDAVLDMVRGTFHGKASGAFGRLLGCDPAVASGWDDPGVGTTVVGFRIVEAEPSATGWWSRDTIGSPATGSCSGSNRWPAAHGARSRAEPSSPASMVGCIGWP